METLVQGVMPIPGRTESTAQDFVTLLRLASNLNLTDFYIRNFLFNIFWTVVDSRELTAGSETSEQVGDYCTEFNTPEHGRLCGGNIPPGPGSAASSLQGLPSSP